MPPSISVVMITLNEEDNLAFALRSVRGWASELIVLDMHSEDRTAEIAREYGAKVYLHERIAAFDGARACAVSHAAGDWILLLDADEIIPKPLSCLLMKLASEGSADIFRVPILTYFDSSPVWFTSWGPHQTKTMRFFKRDKIVLGSAIHRFYQPAPEARIETLAYQESLAIHHFGYVDSSDVLKKLNRNTTIEAQQAFERGKRAGKVKGVLHSFYVFLNYYIRRQGYRDGWRGFYLSGFHAMYRWAIYAKLQELYSTSGRLRIMQQYRDTANELLAPYESGADGLAKRL